MGGIWEAIKTHKWLALGVGGAVVLGVVIYAVTHKGTSTNANTQGDLLATSGGGPTGVIPGGDGSSGGGGGGNGSGVSPATPATPANPYTGGVYPGYPDVPATPPTVTPVPAPNPSPAFFTPPPVTPAPPSAPITTITPQPAAAQIPVGLSGVNYSPGPNTPNQITIPSAAGPTQIALPVGETISTPVSVPNASAGNPVVPLGDLISTGSTNTLSSAYGNAVTAAQATQYLNPVPASTQAKTATATKTTITAKPVSADASKVAPAPAKAPAPAPAPAKAPPISSGAGKLVRS